MLEAVLCWVVFMIIALSDLKSNERQKVDLKVGKNNDRKKASKRVETNKQRDRRLRDEYNKLKEEYVLKRNSVVYPPNKYRRKGK